MTRSRSRRLLVQTALPSLTRREREIVEWLGTDATFEAIAVRLKVSTETVRTHARNIYAKLDVRTRHGAVGALAYLRLLPLKED